MFDALPAQIALLNEDGEIVDVNVAWKRSRCESLPSGRNLSVGENFLTSCDSAVGAFAEESSAVASGIRSVIAGERDESRIECPRHISGEDRWFVLCATSFTSDEGALRIILTCEEIATRRQADQSAARTQGALRIAARLGRLGAWSVQMPESILTWSDELCAIHEMPPGFSPPIEEAIHFCAPEYHARVVEAFEECLRDGKSFDEELEIITANGRRLWARWIGERVFSEESGAIWVQGAFQDISGIKAAEQEIRHQARRFGNIVESMTDAFCILDNQWCFTHVNSEAARLFEHASSQLVGCNVWEVFAEGKGTAFDAALHRAVETRRKVSFEAYYPPFRKWLQVRAYPSSEGLAVYLQDITESHLASEMTRISEERLRLLSEATHDGLWDWNLATNAVWLSASFSEVFGQEAEPASPTFAALRERIHPEEIESIEAQLQAFLQSDCDTWSGEHRFQKSDGSYAFVLSRGFLVRDAHGAASRMLGSLVDITARRRAEDALRESERRSREQSETEKTNRAKSEFLSRMSHELRTPLNAILGFSQLLQADCRIPADEESLNEIVRAGKHLLALINDVLDMASLEEGRMPVALEAVFVTHRIDETLSLLKPLATDRGIFLLSSAAQCDSQILANGQRFSQVLINLVSNAIKFNRIGGSVSVTVQEKDERLRVSVSDTGRGISAENVEKLFVPFERFDVSKRAVEGSGLGLSLCRSLVRAMGGEIGVESLLNEGTTFWVEFPLVLMPLILSSLPGDEDALDRNKAPASTCTVLYIEDNMSNLHLVERVLARRPAVKLISAPDGCRGLGLAREHQPDLILLDLSLPDISGEEVLKALQTSPETIHIPVVVVSADAATVRIERVCEIGASDYLTKPIDIRRLLALVDESGHRQARRA